MGGWGGDCSIPFVFLALIPSLIAAEILGDRAQIFFVLSVFYRYFGPSF